MTTQEREHISEHFTWYELTRSGAALEHALDNTPNDRQRQALRALAENVLEPLRRRFGPIVVSSGFRSPAVNRLVGGVPGSQHLRGEAADIVIGDMDRGLRICHHIRRHLDFDQLIFEPLGSPTPRWLHVSYTATRRNRREMV